MKILLNQRFGLGNQLFQYAAGLYFARQYNAPFEIIRQPKHMGASYGYPRPFLLSQFCITTPVRDRTSLDRILRSKSAAVAALAAPVRHLLGAHSHDPEFLIIGDFCPRIPIPAHTRRLYLNGHFQAHQYAQAVEQRLRREFTFRQPPTGKNLEILSRIRDAECPVSLHVRLGDYNIECDGKNLLPSAYYRNAIHVITRRHPNATFFIFSDDIASARRNLPFLASAIFVDHNKEDTAHEDLRLMSSCRHHILANSTFSWWGAWLNPDPEKIVLAPQPWHAANSPRDLIPPAWQTIPTGAPSSLSTSRSASSQLEPLTVSP